MLNTSSIMLCISGSARGLGAGAGSIPYSDRVSITLGGSTEQTQKNEPWAPAQPHLEQGLKDISALYKQGGFSTTPFSGDMVAGFGDASQGAQRGIMNMAQGGAPLIDAAQGYLTNAMDPNWQSSQLDAVKNRALGSAIPAATATFSGSGMMNSTPAIEGVTSAAVDAVAPYEYGAYNQAQGRAMNAAGMAPSMTQAGYLPMQMMAGVGGQQDAMAQNMINAEMRRHYETEGQGISEMQNYLNMLMPIAGSGGTSATTKQQQMGLGGLFDIAGAGLSLFSDRRLKEDIKKIGMWRGVPLYEYRYLGTPTVQVGVMADEVPHAAVRHGSGFMMVNYGAV